MTAPIWLALALSGSSGATPPVTVEIVAVGHVDAPATVFTLSVDLTASGDTEEKAKDALARNKAALLDKLKAIGVTLVPVAPGAEKKPKFDLSALDTTTATADADDKGKTEDIKPSVQESFSVEGHDRASIVKAQEIIGKTEGASADQPPLTSVSDMSVPMRAAKRDALAKARLDADNYAATLGYSGATILTISERADLGTMYATVLSMAGTARNGRPTMFEPSRGDTVPTDVAVVVTFRLDGKK